MRLLGRVWGLAALSLPAVATAQTPPSLADRFGALESIQHMSISPDGTKLAYVAPAADGSRLIVADLAGGGFPKPILAQRRAGETLRGCRWATDLRLVCTTTTIVNYGGYLLPFSRLFAVDSTGANVAEMTGREASSALDILTYGGQVIDWDLPGKPGRVLITRQFVPEEASRVGVKRDVNGIGVEEIDVVSLSRSIVEKARSEAVEYISDGQGNVRIMGILPRSSAGYLRSNIFYSFRKPGSREWESLSKVSLLADGRSSGFEPYAIDSEANVAYGFDDNAGFRALFRMKLDGTVNRELLLARSDVDVDGLVQIGRDRRVVGVSYATERRVVEYFDPALKKLAAGLSKALPGNPSIAFIDASINEDKLLLLASSDVDPGTFYRFDRLTKKLEPILPLRSELAGLTMSEMKPITYPASDGAQIPGYLTLPPGSSGRNLPAIVMPHGGPGSRDEWGFDWLVQYFAQRGFAVIQPNFRGSAGYGSAWYQRNGFQSWRTSVGDVNDAGKWLVAQGIADPAKLAVVGWSYGGYAALQSGVLEPALFKAVVAIAPVTDLGELRSDAQNTANYPLVNNFIGQGAHVKEGSPAQNAPRLAAPVLMFHGDKDINVRITQSRLMSDRLRGAGKPVELVEFPGLDHQLANSAARSRMLGMSDAFLRRSMGMAAN